MDTHRRNLLKAGVAVTLGAALPTQAMENINQNQELEILLQDGVIYSQGPTQVQAGTMVSFTNLLTTPVYLNPVNNLTCPFTESWPRYIGPNQKVKRVLLDNISGQFNFSFYPLAFAGDKYTQEKNVSLTQSLTRQFYHPQSQLLVTS